MLELTKNSYGNDGEQLVHTFVKYALAILHANNDLEIDSWMYEDNYYNIYTAPCTVPGISV